MRNTEFKFLLNVSNEGYERKGDARACVTQKGAEAIGRKKMCFFERNVTIDEFMDYALKGHSFCALFRFEKGKKYWYSAKNGEKFCSYPYYQRDDRTGTKGALKMDFKRDEFFFGSQTIFIDIDLTKYTDIAEYQELLTYKPTCIYMSYSDNIEKNGVVSRRFHLVYVFDQILNADDFKSVANILSNQLVVDTKEELDDDCGKKMSQYMNGCYGNKENYKSYAIYNVNDIINLNRNKVPPQNNFHSSSLNEEMQKDELSQEKDISQKLDTKLLKDYDRLSVKEFKKLPSWIKYLKTTKYIYRKDNGEWIDNRYQMADDDYFSLFFYLEVQKDGSKRRKGLFERMCLRRLLNPKITPNEILINTIIDIFKFYDNSDGVLDSNFIIRNIKNAFEMTLEDIEVRFGGELRYLKEVSKKKRGIIYKDQKAHRQETTFRIVDKFYDTKKNINENLALINSNAPINISERTLYNYIKSRGIKTDITKLTDNELISKMDWNKIAIENYRIIKDMGYKISKKRLYKIYNNKTNYLVKSQGTSTTTFNVEVQKKEESIWDILNYRSEESPKELEKPKLKFLVKYKNDEVLDELLDILEEISKKPFIIEEPCFLKK